jgi:hypothetical protein
MRPCYFLKMFRHSVRSVRNDLRLASIAVFALAQGIGASKVVFRLFKRVEVPDCSAASTTSPSAWRYGGEAFTLTERC